MVYSFEIDREYKWEMLVTPTNFIVKNLIPIYLYNIQFIIFRSAMNIEI